MAITLTVAVYQSETANTYISLADANSYHESRLHNSEWFDATTEQKKAALVWATRSLDSWMFWEGQRADENQILEWPRNSVKDRSGFSIEHTDIPIRLKDATAELAFLLVKSDRSAERSNNSAAGLDSLEVEGIKLSFNPSDRIEEIPDSVSALLIGLGVTHSATTSQAKLVRV